MNTQEQCADLYAENGSIAEFNECMIAGTEYAEEGYGESGGQAWIAPVAEFGSSLAGMFGQIFAGAGAPQGGSPTYPTGGTGAYYPPAPQPKTDWTTIALVIGGLAVAGGITYMIVKKK